MSWTQRARFQHGLITRRQLIDAGVSPSSQVVMRRQGRLEATPARGIFRVAGAPFTPGAAAWFAVLSSRSPLSFLTAAEWWDMEVEQDGLVHITRLDRRRLDWPTGVRVHRVALLPDVVTERYGLQLTDRVETALDCMGWLPLTRARRFADRAVQQGWLSVQDIERRLRDQPRRWGNRQLRQLLLQVSDGAAAESERMLHRLLRSRGITGWVPNLAVIVSGHRYVIDVAFPHLRLAIEVDGFDYHRRDRFQRDRTKQNALIGAGWTVLRFTWSDIEDRPEYVIASIRATFGGIGGSGEPIPPKVGG